MALSSTIYKAEITLSNLNDHYYDDFSLTMAKHPSENEERMMRRLLCFLSCAHKDLEFTKGLSSTDEPELWQKSLTGDILHWIELGEPDEKRIRQASGKSKRVSIFTVNKNTSEQWFLKVRDKVSHEKVNIFHLENLTKEDLTSLVTKSMKLSCTIEDDSLYLSNDERTIHYKIDKKL
ncbi:YaeQ family protein [Halobacteriovorax sp. JY17]|uniref:YaeQ family protein n=1 Tax=Halobacteriovorax sp. JY17 TaxID=2014617 RepID=UPI000C497C1C|nr:YaeQ family protein [Halobacteriovorax sp. JY17]PIK15215.1 MAG: hypothetical protein CES88_00455 [Halobacteriovorax sp. JY17]